MCVREEGVCENVCEQKRVWVCVFRGAAGGGVPEVVSSILKED